MKIIYQSDTHKVETASSATIAPQAIRKITTRAFMQRFTLTERVALRASTDDTIIDIYEDLKLASYVDLDDSDVSSAIDYFVAQNLLTSNRKSEVLTDGTQLESI